MIKFQIDLGKHDYKAFLCYKNKNYTIFILNAQAM